MNQDQGGRERPPGFWTSRYAIGLIVIGAVAGYFLLAEHRAHVFGVLPYLLLLACPLMHLFMHHGHGRHGSGHADPHGGAQGSNRSAPPPGPKTGEQP